MSVENMTNTKVTKMRKKLHDVNDELERLAAKFDALLKNQISNDQDIADDSIYTEQQEREWLKSEPTFTKRIAKPLRNRRKGNLMITFFLLALSMPHGLLLLASVPNDLSHPYPPNNNNTRYLSFC